MSEKNRLQPLLIVGLTLFASGLVFSIFLLATGSPAVTGVALGCLVSGFLLTVVSLVQKKRPRSSSR